MNAPYQPELTAPTSSGTGRDSLAEARDAFAEVRAEHPEARLVRFHDRRHGVSFVMAVPPSSPWYELLPPQQDVHIKRTDAGAPSA